VTGAWPTRTRWQRRPPAQLAEREREKGGGGVRGVAHPHTLAAASTRTRWQRRPPAHAGSGARATRPFHRPAHGQRAAIRLLHPRHTALETATSKADPRQEHDWLFERLRGGRACHLEACGGRRSILLLSTRSFDSTFYSADGSFMYRFGRAITPPCLLAPSGWFALPVHLTCRSPANPAWGRRCVSPRHQKDEQGPHIQEDHRQVPHCVRDGLLSD
jgi:hypothetical protein